MTIGIAAAICIALSPVSQDPYLVWMYASLAIVGFVAGCIFYLCFRKSDAFDQTLVEGIPVEEQAAVSVTKVDGGKNIA